MTEKGRAAQAVRVLTGEKPSEESPAIDHYDTKPHPSPTIKEALSPKEFTVDGLHYAQYLIFVGTTV